MARIAIASFSGTAIEFYDFFVYGTAAALVLGELFFPSFSPVAGTLAAFATYAVGFVARPLGSLLFGHIGDRLGRRPVLVVSLLLTGLATVLVGVLPTYDHIGVAAPVLLVVLRFLQGLGLGGEWGGAVLLATEHAPARRRGLWASFPQTGPSVGFLLANGVMLALSASLSDAQFESWGWRIPFLGAGVLVAVGLILRTSMEETPAFRELTAHQETARVPLIEVFRDHWRVVLLASGGLAIGYAVFYTVTTWALHHGTHELDVSRTTMLACIMVAVAVKGVCTPIAAVLGDRFGRKPLCVAGTVAVLVWTFPLIALLETGHPVAMTVGFAVALLGFITMFAVLGAYLPELFEPRVRCTGASTAYNLGGVLGGALTPIAATELSRGDGTPWPVGAYLTVIACASLLCFLALPETRPEPEQADSANRADPTENALPPATASA
ncbi:MFS transporter [Yinghuangia sp. YIM S10712]|uniref:MFS transporter n=1 Tax=Yinghuangia sp. YIM S10712 TaxID=3436930 RepID=UPI003F536284